MPRTPIGWFRLLAVAEACSWAGLLLGMFFKYVIPVTTAGVTVFGWVHGLAFTAYVVMCLVVFSSLRWRFPVLLAALIASVPPFATVAFERWATKTGRLRQPDTDEPTFWARVGHIVRELN